MHAIRVYIYIYIILYIFYILEWVSANTRYGMQIYIEGLVYVCSKSPGSHCVYRLVQAC